MTLKQITDALFAGKMVGNEMVGWMYVDPRDGFLVAERDYEFHPSDDSLVGYLFCSCDNLEVRERGLI